MSWQGKRRREEERLRRFLRCWDEILQTVPEARQEALEAAAEAVKRSLDAQIQNADLSSIEAKGRVSSWQQIRLGSGGGWSAVSPPGKTVYSWDRRANFGGRARQHTWHGRPVTARQVTGWLENGHGTGTTGRMETVWTKQIGTHTREARWGSGYVARRPFYARTNGDAQDIALEAAEKVLNRIKAELEDL